MGLQKPRVIDFSPLVSKCERRLIAASSFLNQAGRLQLTNSVITALPTFAMSTFRLQNTVIEQIDKYRKHCLWRGSDLNSKKPASVAWPVVCRSKTEGGLGALNLRTQNEALLMKYLHKFINREDIPWVNLIWEIHYDNGRLPVANNRGSFWWKDVLRLLDNFKGLAKVDLKDGRTCFLWSDIWKDTIPTLAFPELFSFTSNKSITVAEAKTLDSLQSIFHLPLSEQAYHQFLCLQQLLENVQPTKDKDVWGFIWGSNQFSSSKIYKHLSGHSHVHAAHRWIWKSSCQNKHKVFFWLILKDRLNTRSMLRRRNMELENFNCVLCNRQAEEIIEHLFIQCPFASQCWNSIGLGVDYRLPPLQNLELLRMQINRKFFMEIIILHCWAIWLCRNNSIFRMLPHSIQGCKDIFKLEFELLLCRAKKKYFPKIQEWITNLN